MNISLQQIACSRTLLFNYGQGIWTPLTVYKDACKLIGCPPFLSPLPSFKEIPFPFSFFSKTFPFPSSETRCQHFMLYDRMDKEEQKEFLSLPSAYKLNWMRNFYWMQELFFSFKEEEIEGIFLFVKRSGVKGYNKNRIAFQLERSSNEQHLTASSPQTNLI